MHKKNFKLLNLIIFIILLMFISGCNGSIEYVQVDNYDSNNTVVNPYPDILRKKVILYFGENSPSQIPKLYKEERIIDYPPNHFEERILKALKNGPESTISFRNVIAPHLEILDVNVVKDSAFVNLSSKNLYGGKKEESILIASIVKTLTSTEKIEKVYFLVDGKKTESLMGNISAKNYFSKDSIDVLLKNPESVYPLTLWFPQKGRSFYSEPSTETRLINHPPNAKTVIGNLLIGPTSLTAKGCIPSNIEILNVTTKDNTAYVNFSNKNLYTYRDNYEIEYNMIYCIVKSLLNLKNIEKVVFLVDGNKGFRLIEKIPIYKPFTKSNLIVSDENQSIPKGSKYTVNIYHPYSLKDPLNFIKWEKSLNKPPTPEDVISGLLMESPNQKIYTDFTLPYIINILNEGHIVYVNMASGDIELHEETYVKMESAITASIVRSLCDLPDVNQVMFFIDGKPRDIFIEKIKINTPLTINSLDKIVSPSYEPEIFDMYK